MENSWYIHEDAESTNTGCFYIIARPTKPDTDGFYKPIVTMYGPGLCSRAEAAEILIDAILGTEDER
jgi:hypothetical protein